MHWCARARANKRLWRGDNTLLEKTDGTAYIAYYTTSHSHHGDAEQ